MSTEAVRYFYRREVTGAGVERRFTVAYQHDKETGKTRYGASVFRRDTPSESYVKRAHRQTAERRLQICPVQITVQANDWAAVETAIRSAIRINGVRGNRAAVV